MQRAEIQAGWREGKTGKLIAESRGGPGPDSAGYYETLFEHYLPGIDHRALTDEAFALKLAHLRHLLQQKVGGKTGQRPNF